jgi:hypothetical protein
MSICPVAPRSSSWHASRSVDAHADPGYIFGVVPNLESVGHLKKRFLISAVCMLALLAVSEYSLRRHFFGRTYSYYSTTEVYWEDQHTLLLYLPDPLTMWRLRPSIELSVSEWIRPYGRAPAEPVRHEWTISTNALGYRTQEFEEEKPNDTLRILCLGDSRTLGEGLEAEETYPDRLSRRLGPNTEVLNLGADGWSAFQGRALLEQEGVHYNPDIVIACFGINDSDRAWAFLTQHERQHKARRM